MTFEGQTQSSSPTSMSRIRTNARPWRMKSAVKHAACLPTWTGSDKSAMPRPAYYCRNVANSPRWAAKCFLRSSLAIVIWFRGNALACNEGCVPGWSVRVGDRICRRVTSGLPPHRVPSGPPKSRNLHLRQDFLDRAGSPADPGVATGCLGWKPAGSQESWAHALGIGKAGFASYFVQRKPARESSSFDAQLLDRLRRRATRLGQECAAELSWAEVRRVCGSSTERRLPRCPVA